MTRILSNLQGGYGMSRPYMTFDSLFETINLQNALSEQSHSASVEYMSTNQARTAGRSKGYYFERKT